MSFSSGLLLRRFSPEILPEAYVALKVPEKQKAIAIKMSTDLIPDISRYVGLKDIGIQSIRDERDLTRSTLLFTLVSNQHQDVFAVLCEDLILSIASTTDEKRISGILLNRIEKWKSLFETASLQGLTSEEQRGLYGELYMLRKWLLNLPSHNNTDSCILAWTGPGKALRDFQSGGVAVEVKTTAGNNHQKLEISSERQLDSRFLESLFLFHLSIEIQQQNGETLNEIIDNIISLLDNNIAGQNLFRTKLFVSGYFQQHKLLYQETGYQVRRETFYVVKSDFPRIEEHNLRAGVGDVKYSIMLSNFKEYIVDEIIIFDILNQFNPDAYGKQ